VSTAVRSQRALVDLLWKADPHPLHKLIERVRTERPDSIANVADNWLLCALVERDWTAAEQALVALGNNPFWGDEAVILQSHFGEALLARAMQDNVRARKAFAAARLKQEQVVQKQQEYRPALCVLALIDTGLGNKGSRPARRPPGDTAFTCYRRLDQRRATPGLLHDHRCLGRREGPGIGAVGARSPNAGRFYRGNLRFDEVVSLLGSAA
jgi:hypothetical protein